MNIVILPTAYPNIYNSNSAIFVQDQALALVKKSDHNIKVVGAIPISLKDIWRKKKLKFGYFKYKKNGVDVTLFLFPSIPKLKRFNNFVRFTFNKIMLRKIASSIDIIHVHNAVAGEAALWSAEKFNTPYCVTEHSSAYARGMIDDYEMKNYKKIYENSKYNIAVSLEFTNLLHKLFALEFTHIANIVDTDFFTPKSREKCTFNFVNIANLNKNKNQLLLIQAFYKVFTNTNVSLTIVGDGTLYDVLKEEINRLNLKDKVTLYGRASREEVLTQLHKADVFVLSSIYETFGVVLIEAMSCGVPVLSTKCGGPESIVSDENLGLLVENRDIDALSQGMLEIYESEFDSDYIRNQIIKNYSQEAIVFELNEVYKKMIK